MKSSALLCLVASLVVSATPLSAQGLRLGAKAGVNIAHVVGDDIPRVNQRTGVSAGAFATLELFGGLSIQAEALYAQKGFRAQTLLDGSVTDLSWATDYLEVPVLLRYTADPFASAGAPVIFAGPTVANLLSARTLVGTDGEAGDMDATDLVRSRDYGVVFGAGLESNTVTFDARYTIGLVSIDAATDPPDQRNATVSFMIGYVLPLGF